MEGEGELWKVTPFPELPFSALASSWFTSNLTLAFFLLFPITSFLNIFVLICIYQHFGAASEKCLRSSSWPFLLGPSPPRFYALSLESEHRHNRECRRARWVSCWSGCVYRSTLRPSLIEASPHSLLSTPCPTHPGRSSSLPSFSLLFLLLLFYYYKNTFFISWSIYVRRYLNFTSFAFPYLLCSLLSSSLDISVLSRHFLSHLQLMRIMLSDAVASSVCLCFVGLGVGSESIS